MKKLNVHALALGALALIVYTALAFLLPFMQNAVFFVAFACTLLMFAVTGAAFWRSFRKDETLESKVLGWPIFKAAVLGLMVQAAVSFVLMALAGLCPVWVAVLVEVAVLAVCAGLLIVRDAGREVVAASEQALPDTTKAMKALRQQAKAVAAVQQDAQVQKAVEKLAEALQFSDPVSSPATEEMETALAGLLAQIKLADHKEEALKLAEQAANLLRQRNDAARMGK
ncbi:MAG: hypothetical protein IJN44_10855 [Clostridia bacterium]|nr:hypothetical protein [Clostridia bacterium]